MRGPLALLVAAALLVAQSGCSHYSENHRRGLLFTSGAAIFIGSVIAADGAYCSKEAAAGECEDGSDRQSLIDGGALFAAGLAVFLAAYFIKPKPPATAAPAP
jgi:hypothetical protein